MRAASLVLLLITGCSWHVRPGMPIGPTVDPIVAEAHAFIKQVAHNMPLWDADEAYARFESKQIAQVKIDILRTQDEERKHMFLDDVEQLRKDWNALIAYDEMLQRSYVL